MAVTKTIGGLTTASGLLGSDLVEVEIAASGLSRNTSLEAFVQAGAGGILPVDIYHRTGVYLVDPNFTVNAAAHRYNTIQAAVTAAPAGSLIKIASGPYIEDITFGQNNVLLVGAGKPYFDGTDLIGGTIIKGQINCNGKIGATLKDLGVDIRAHAQDDAIYNSTGGTTPKYQRFENLRVVGKGSATAGDRGHGILLQSGGYNSVTNCDFHLWYHGLAFRCSHSTVTNSRFYSCFSDAVIIKSDTGSEDADYCLIGDCESIGTTGSAYDRAGPFKVESAHASYHSNHITIDNCVCQNTAEAAVLITKTAGAITDVLVSNVTETGGGDSAGRAQFDVDSATVVNFVNCHSTSRSAGYGFRARGTAAQIRVVGCVADSTGAGQSTTADTGTFDYLDIGPGTPITIAPKTTTDVAMRINMPTSTSGASLQTQYAGTTRQELYTSSTLNYFQLKSFDNGSSVGPEISVQRNSNGSTPAPGAYSMMQSDGNNRYIYAYGSVLYWYTAPPTNANQASGTIVGTQSSTAESKNILEGLSPIDDVLTRIVLGSQSVRRFNYRDGRMSSQEFEGVVTNYAPDYGMDRTDEVPQGKSLNEITIIGDLLRAVAHLAEEFTQLKATLGL